MKQIMAIASVAVAVVAGAAAITRADHDHDDDHHHEHGCRDVHATIVDAPAPDGCASPFGFCAAGEAHGNEGLDGTTLFTLDGFSPAPATSPGLGETSGILVYTTDHGTLTVRETGVGNMGAAALGGVGASLEIVQSGTGRFAGATGTFYLASSAANGQYTAIVTGSLCYP